MTLTWMFCADLLEPRKVDDHWRAEADVVRQRGDQVVLVDHDRWVAGDVHGAVAGVVDVAGPVVYRGWMVNDVVYAQLVTLLEGRGVKFVTDAHRYRGAHLLPKWWEQLQDHTADSVWTASDSRDELAVACTTLFDRGVRSAVLRDWSKSAKDRFEEAMWIQDLGDFDHINQIAGTFREIRGSSFDHGFVVRAFEEFEGFEARTWWVDGACVAVTAHPDTPDDAFVVDCAVTDVFASAVAACDVRFCTVDITRRSDGVWRIVELGDAQVSDRPRSAAPDRFVAAVAAALTRPRVV